MELRRDAEFSTCTDCQPLNTPGMRSTTTHAEGRIIRYLRQFWVCAVCGREWEDAELDRLNEVALEQAHVRTRDRRPRPV
jgi:uncharacterized protein with PIN domain